MRLASETETCPSTTRFFAFALSPFPFTKDAEKINIICERNKVPNYFPIMVIFSKLHYVSVLFNTFTIIQFIQPVTFNKWVRILCSALSIFWGTRYLGSWLWFCPRIYGWNFTDRSLTTISFWDGWRKGK
jgi:hypothetical protein